MPNSLDSWNYDPRESAKKALRNFHPGDTVFAYYNRAATQGVVKSASYDADDTDHKYGVRSIVLNFDYPLPTPSRTTFMLRVTYTYNDDTRLYEGPDDTFIL